MKPRLTRSGAGFTLVEVLVALVVMAVLAGLAWQGVNGMVVSRDVTSKSIERISRLNTVMAQWERDLESLYVGRDVPPLECVGQSLHLTRHSGDGVVIVVWSLRSGSWQRWVSPLVTRGADLREQGFRGRGLLGNEAGVVNLLEGVEEFNTIFIDGNGREFNCQSTGDTTLPAAVDLRLKIDGQPLRRVTVVVPLS